MGEALRTISFKVKTASCGGTACVNSFGDEQLAVDMLANNLLFEVSLEFTLHEVPWRFKLHDHGLVVVNVKNLYLPISKSNCLTFVTHLL